jgi:ribosome biogenesis GTPase
MAGAGAGERHPLHAWGWDERVERWWASAPRGTIAARVVRADRGRVVLQAASGTFTAPASAAGWSDGAERMPTTGDWVAVAPADAGGADTIAGVLPRFSAITRIDAHGHREQVLAANVDSVLAVHGLDRPVRGGRLERTLVLAWEGGAQPTVVATKTDLVDDPTPALEALAALAPGVEVLAVSARRGTGLDPIRELLRPNRTAVMLGESGAGKSTLANRLVGEEVQATRGVRAGDAKGRHTTVTRDLLLVPTGGVLIDTPGLRGLGLWEAEEGLALAFPDIEELASGCRFRDCGHEHEPGCAVRAAAEAGTLDPARLARYAALRREAQEAEARREAVARRERRRPGTITQTAWRTRPGRRR